MSDARCHSCGAAVPPEAQWCSLCFADLRVPAAVLEPVTVPAAPAPAPVAAVAPVATPASAEVLTAGLPTPAAPVDPGVAQPQGATVAKEATWPCPRCNASVAISQDVCPECGAGFLSNVAQVTNTKLPIVGDVGRMSQGQRLMIGAGISVVLMVIFVMILEIGGHLFG